MAVSRVDIHHEGGGDPSTDVQRFAEGGYVVGIGCGRWVIFRRAVDNWATKYFNHVDVAICFSGNRMTFPITDDDLRCVRESMAELRRRGEVVDNPEVHPHGTLYKAAGGNLEGSSPTQCPGIKTLERWPEIVAACQADAPEPPQPSTPPSPVRLEEPLLVTSHVPHEVLTFRGARIDIAGRSITAHGGAGVIPSPAEIPDLPWLGAEAIADDPKDQVRRFKVVTSDGKETRFRVK